MLGGMRMFLLLAALAGCTSLGPMPATTGLGAMPAQRPSAEVSAGGVPVYRLSTAASDTDRNGDVTGQLSVLFEPDRLLGVPGLVVAMRSWGDQWSDAIEPMVGYRRKIEQFAISGVVYGTHMADESKGASYSATRVGGELAVGARFMDQYLKADAQLAVSATYLSADGMYCADASGLGRDCEEQEMATVAGELAGVYPAATASVSLALGPPASWFHDVRVSGIFSVGYMPRLLGGEQQRGTAYTSGGLLLKFGFGATD